MKKDNIFWVSYSDLMTSLFFVMLVLFVVSIGFLQFQKNATERQLKKIKELQTSVQKLDTSYFEYQPQYKRFKLNKQIQFDKGDSDIKQEYYSYLIQVGMSINNLITMLNVDSTYKNLEIKYLVVIEGMASIDHYSKNFELSYQRALSLYRLWKQEITEGTIFDPRFCEIQISGSGTEGIREYQGSEEYKNQQFLIHIIPKIGKVVEDNHL